MALPLKQILYYGINIDAHPRRRQPATFAALAGRRVVDIHRWKTTDLKDADTHGSKSSRAA